MGSKGEALPKKVVEQDFPAEMGFHMSPEDGRFHKQRGTEGVRGGRRNNANGGARTHNMLGQREWRKDLERGAWDQLPGPWTRSDGNAWAFMRPDAARAARDWASPVVVGPYGTR